MNEIFAHFNVSKTNYPTGKLVLFFVKTFVVITMILTLIFTS